MEVMIVVFGDAVSTAFAAAVKRTQPGDGNRRIDGEVVAVRSIQR